MTDHVNLTGVLLAAGRGSRAGGTKQLLPVVTSAGVGPLVCAAYDAVDPACASMIVVLGHEPDAVHTALGRRKFQCINVDPDAPMAESVRAGLRAAIETHPTRAVLLQPADHAWVRPDTLELLIGSLATAPGRAVMPTFRGRGGHPVLIPAPIAHQIIRDELPAGLREFWLRHPALCLRIPVTDAGVIRDVDRA